MIRNALIIFFFTAPLLLIADVNVSALFSDGMVLQQGQPVPVWGWADPGSSVAVSFADQERSTKVPDSGKWMVKLSPLKASEQGRAMSIRVDGESKVIKDVLVGEVWICAGQSNMNFTLLQLSSPAREPQYQPIVDYIKNEVKTATDPLLRQIVVPHRVSPKTPIENFTGSWVAVSPATNEGFTGTGYFFARELRRELGVPVGLISCPRGGTLIEPWIPASGFQKTSAFKEFYDAQHRKLVADLAAWSPAKAKERYANKLKKWQANVKKEEAKKTPRTLRKPSMTSAPGNSPRIPSTLYNGMIHSVIPFAMKGTIWYQGESNRRQHAKEYGAYFTELITSWREKWGQGDFPFYYCQLAQYMPPKKDPGSEDGWIDVCDQQRLTLALKNTGMAVLNDVGEAKDIHPRNKIDAGKRLALWALAKDYGKSIPAHSGPLYKSHVISGNKIVVTFDEVGSGLMVGKKILLNPTKPESGPLQRFQICGAGKQWKWADAKITGKDTVEISHKNIAKPVAVRYAWATNPKGANLYNKEGLPASLFRTDSW